MKALYSYQILMDITKLLLSFYFINLSPRALSLSFTEHEPDHNSYHKSISQTAYTLKSSQVEVGLGSLNYGISDDWMLSTSTLTLLGNAATVSTTKNYTFERFTVAAKAGADWLKPRLPPFIENFNTLRYKKFDFSLGLKCNYLTKYEPTIGLEYEKKPDLELQLSTNMDYHISNNKFLYLGSKGSAIYLGLTFQFGYFFVGLITFGHILPTILVPYFYFRF